jgi:hypothetical protein
MRLDQELVLIDKVLSHQGMDKGRAAGDQNVATRFSFELGDFADNNT